MIYNSGEFMNHERNRLGVTMKNNLIALLILGLGFGFFARADQVKDQQILQQLAVQALEFDSESS